MTCAGCRAALGDRRPARAPLARRRRPPRPRLLPRPSGPLPWVRAPPPLALPRALGALLPSAHDIGQWWWEGRVACPCRTCSDNGHRERVPPPHLCHVADANLVQHLADQLVRLLLLALALQRVKNTVSSRCRRLRCRAHVTCAHTHTHAPPWRRRWRRPSCRSSSPSARSAHQGNRATQEGGVGCAARLRSAHPRPPESAPGRTWRSNSRMMFWS